MKDTFDNSSLVIFTDGGSRGNPGPAAIGVVAFLDGKQVFENAEFIGQATNNEAEYLAFIQSVSQVLSHKFPSSPQKIEWKLDSLLVVQQLNKKWKIKEARLRDFAQKAWSLLNELPYKYSITHVPREENKEADLLVNQALDTARQ